MPKSCPICGGPGPFNKEHVFPEWVHKSLASQGPFTTKRAGKQISPKLKITVCASCNSWSADIFEVPAKPLLIPMFEGKEQVLSIEHQQLVASWLVKTILFARLAMPGENFPTDHYRHLREYANPPPNSILWIASVDYLRIPKNPSEPGVVPVHSSTPETLMERFLDGCDGSYWQIGCLCATFYSCGERDVSSIRNWFVEQGFVFQLWPLSDNPLRWPPGIWFDMTTIQAWKDWFFVRR